MLIARAEEDTIYDSVYDSSDRYAFTVVCVGLAFHWVAAGDLPRSAKRRPKSICPRRMEAK